MMDFPPLRKDVNNHHMEINAFSDQGGGLEEIYFWCHTCDPEGKNLFLIDVRTTYPAVAAIRLMEYADQHCKE